MERAMRVAVNRALVCDTGTRPELTKANAQV